jgi:hypothetical protein
MDGSTLNNRLKELLLQRKEAREQKNWGESDRLRNLLKIRGITVEDRKGGEHAVHLNELSVHPLFRENYKIHIGLQRLMSRDHELSNVAHEYRDENLEALVSAAQSIVPPEINWDEFKENYRRFYSQIEFAALTQTTSGAWSPEQVNLSALGHKLIKDLETIIGSVIL